MNSFFIEYRDPLFSIIIFFVLIFIITFFSYWWSKHKRKEDSKYLDKFLQNFQTPPTQGELSVLISSGQLSIKSWLLLAGSYYKSGEYEKAIEIYNEVLKADSLNSKETMFLLAKTYYKAGFLERSKQIFLEILKKNPRTPQALHYLLLVYEQMRDYRAAIEVLEPLAEQGEETTTLESYLHILTILSDAKLASEQKKELLLQLYKEYHEHDYLIFEYLFRVDTQSAWKNFDSSKSELLSDIFWQLSSEDLDLDIISKNGFLRELYSARGDLSLASSSSIFEFDILIKLQNRANATLAFEYVCESCKGVYPFVSHRCSSCHTIGSLRPEYRITKDYYRDFSEENNSFQ